MNLPHRLSEVILERRKHLDLSQQSVADAAGLPRALLSRLETGIPTRLTQSQFQAVGSALGLPPDWLAGTDWDWGDGLRSLRVRGRQLANQYRPMSPSTEPPSTPFQHKLSVLGAEFRLREQELERAVLARPESRLLLTSLRDTWCDSKPEGVVWLAIASTGDPGRLSTADVGFHQHRVTCPKGLRYAGSAERLVWHSPGVGLLFPQVTMTPGRIPIRVDALVAFGKGHFGVLEVDGEGHVALRDRDRERELGLPHKRLTSADVADRGLLACLADLARQVLATAPVLPP